MKLTKKKRTENFEKINKSNMLVVRPNKQTNKTSKQTSKQRKQQIINIRSVEVINTNVNNYIKQINKEKKDQVYDHKTEIQMKYGNSLKEINYYNSYKKMTT